MKLKVSLKSDELGVDINLPDIDVPQKYISVFQEGTKIASVIAEAIKNIQSETEE